jgi:hypothetical protein
MGQGVSRVVDHGERGVRVLVDEVGGGGIPDRLQMLRTDERRSPPAPPAESLGCPVESTAARQSAA